MMRTGRHKMNSIFPTLLLTFWYCCSYTANGQSAANFVVEKFEICDIPNQIINMSIVIKTFDEGRQFIDGYFFTPIPVGNQLRLVVEVEMEITMGAKRYWQHLFKVEDDFCRVLQVYLGEMIYDVETAAGIPHGACPIPKGRYHITNFTPNFSRLKLQTFPFGRMRATLNLLEKPKKNVALCAVFILTNKA